MFCKLVILYTRCLRLVALHSLLAATRRLFSPIKLVMKFFTWISFATFQQCSLNNLRSALLRRKWKKKIIVTANECGYSNCVRTWKRGEGEQGTGEGEGEGDWLWLTLHLSWSHGNLRAEQLAKLQPLFTQRPSHNCIKLYGAGSWEWAWS